MSLLVYIKDPVAVLDYGLDWTQWLQGRTIVTSTWTVPAGLNNVSSTNTSTQTTIILSGGTLGDQYDVTNTITCTDGSNTYEDERTFSILIQKR